jgi:general secretion pathway protein D
MRRFSQLLAITLTSVLILPPAPLGARTRKGDRIRNEARSEETRGNYDHALELAEQAMAMDSTDPSYILLVRRLRFEAGAQHVKSGQQMRAAGQLEQALAEFQKAYGLDPASDVAVQEINRTREMIERNKNGGQPPAASIAPEEKKTLTPAELARRETQERTDALLPVPELRPLNSDLIDLRMNNQRPRVMFETVCKLAGVNVLFDPEYNQQQTLPSVSIDLSRTTLEESLDQLAVITRSFWKPLSSNTIFVTIDNPTKRREYAEQVVRVFYLSNITSPQEMQEILTVLRTVVDVQKVFNYTAQNALVVRAEADTMAVVEKLIADLDKPRAEVLIDVMVMQVSSTYMRNLSAAFAPTGITTSAVFAPGGVQNSSSTTGTTTTPTTSTTETPTGTNGTGTTNNALSLSRLGHISSADYSLTNLPGAQFEAVLNDSATRVMQSPQIRAVDNAKASLKIGTKVPTASGSFQPGVAGVGVSPLVNTQFTYLDVGVNVDILPRVHQNNEVSLHVELEVSQVNNQVNLGGISIPEIGQNKAVADIRLKDSEVNLIGGIIQDTNSRAITGIPGLAGIPLLGRLFSAENIQKGKSELVIVLIPHIVRGIDISSSNLKPTAVGNATQIKVGYAPRRGASEQPQGAPPAPAVPAPPAAAPQPGAPPATAPPVAEPPTAAQPATVPPGAAPPAGGPARISFLPGTSVDTQLSQTVNVTLYAENVADLVSAAAHLQYDPKILRINNIVAGDLPQKNVAPLQPSRNILNDSGQADVSVSRAPADGGASGSGGLFTIVFQAVGRGNTSVTVSGIALNGAAANAAPGQRIPSNTPPPLTVNVK